MNNQDYTASIEVAASAKAAFDGINSVSKWWVTNTDGNSEKLGDVFSVRWNGPFVTFKISESVPEKSVVWDVTDCDLPFLKDTKEWVGTKVVFDIAPKGNATDITLTHVGLAPELECYGGCVKGWDQYFKDSLFKLITDGKGQPS